MSLATIKLIIIVVLLPMKSINLFKIFNSLSIDKKQTLIKKYISRIVKFVITRLKSNSLPIDYLCIEEEYGILCIIILRVRSD